MSKISFDYYYERESSQYNYYQIPQVLIKDPCFKPLSLGAKLLYSIMLNRMYLSRKNHWLDDDGKVFIYFSLAEIRQELNVCKETAVKFLAELDGAKGIGLIERVRQGQGKPDKIYIKNFARITAESEEDVPEEDAPEDAFSEEFEAEEDSEVGNSDFKKSENDTAKEEKPDHTFKDAHSFGKAEKPTSDSHEHRPQEVGETDFQKSGNPTSKGQKTRLQDVGKTDLPLNSISKPYGEI